MRNAQTEQSPLSSKRSSFESITQLIRWLVIAVVAASFWDLQENKLIILGLLTAAILYNLLRMTPLSRVPVFKSFITIIAVDILFAVLVLCATGGITSPYIILLIPMLMSGAYWYGTKGLTAVGIVEAAVVATLVYFSNLSMREWPLALASFMLMLIIGYYVLRLTQDDREERNELRRLNTAVQRERRQLESLVNSMSDAVVVVDSSGIINLANTAASTILSLQEFIGRPFDDVVTLHDTEGKVVPLFANGSPEQDSIRNDLVEQRANETISLEVRLTPFKVAGNPQGTIIMARDITKQKTLEDERTEFISLASHELKTPLALAEGNLSLAMSQKNEPLSEATMTLLQKTYRSVRQLSAIVSDLTTLDQADKGLLDVELERVNVSEIVETLIADYASRAGEKQITLSHKIDPQVKPVVTSKFRLVEILVNFLTNAIKYTPNGGSVVIGVASDDHGGGVMISVADNGKGMSTADQQKIFEKFYRSEDYRTRETEGTGLGLYIVKKLTARLGGEVWLESELNKGTTFYLRVPQYSSRREDQPKVIAADVDSFITGV